jgi:hypothetical protein
MFSGQLHCNMDSQTDEGDSQELMKYNSIHAQFGNPVSQ